MTPHLQNASQVKFQCINFAWQLHRKSSCWCSTDSTAFQYDDRYTKLCTYRIWLCMCALWLHCWWFHSQRLSISSSELSSWCHNVAWHWPNPPVGLTRCAFFSISQPSSLCWSLWQWRTGKKMQHTSWGVPPSFCICPWPHAWQILPLFFSLPGWALLPSVAAIKGHIPSLTSCVIFTLTWTCMQGTQFTVHHKTTWAIVQEKLKANLASFEAGEV